MSWLSTLPAWIRRGVPLTSAGTPEHALPALTAPLPAEAPAIALTLPTGTAAVITEASNATLAEMELHPSDGDSGDFDADDFDAELRAYRQRAERKLRASRQANLARPPALRPYRGSEHLLSLICPPLCALCDAPVDGIQQAICPKCEAHALPRQTALTFGPCWSPFQHDELSRRAVSRFKFYGERWRGYQLAQHAALTWYAELDALMNADDRLVAVPLSTRRIRKRGFNQAQVLVRGIQQRLRLRSCERSLFRRDGPSGDQKHRSREERLKQRDLFDAQPLRAGQRVWLVDDVVTTGATLEDAARALDEVGVHAIGAVTLTWTL